MSLTTGELRDKLVPGSSASMEPSQAVVAAVGGMITEDEWTKYRLPGKAGLVHEREEETETIERPADGQSLALVTDQKLLFVLASAETSTVREVAYTNLRSVDAKDGLLRSKLTVREWGNGEFRFKIADSTDLGAAVDYIEAATECWERVVSAVEDATEQTQLMGQQLEAGDSEAASEHRNAAKNDLERARAYLDRADIERPKTLVERIRSATLEHVRTEIRNRLTRAETLITQARYEADAREYTDSYQCYTDARSHLERARELASEAELPEPQVIETKLDTIDTRLRHLEVRPLALAKQASERAKGTNKLETEVEAWQEAFEHYRDALVAGWGTDLEFEGEVWRIKQKIETIVFKLLETRQTLANRYEEHGDELADSQPKAAVSEYEVALEQLEQAQQMASVYRVGDPAEFDDQLDRITAKRLDCR